MDGAAAAVVGRGKPLAGARVESSGGMAGAGCAATAMSTGGDAAFAEACSTGPACAARVRTGNPGAIGEGTVSVDTAGSGRARSSAIAAAGSATDAACMEDKASGAVVRAVVAPLSATGADVRAIVGAWAGVAISARNALRLGAGGAAVAAWSVTVAGSVSAGSAVGIGASIPGNVAA